MPFEEHHPQTARERRPPWKRRHSAPLAWALAVFVACLATASWFALAEYNRARNEAHRTFVADARRIASGIQSQLDDCEQLIRAFQSVFMTSDEVTPGEFAQAYANMKPEAHRISLQALAYAERRPRADGDHYVTTMFAPREGNASILGLDVREQPTNLDALLQSRDSNRIAMSRPFRLRQSGNGAHAVDGFILRLPVYAGGRVPEGLAARRESLAGSVGASFRIADLIASTMPADLATVAGVRVDDISDGGHRRLYTRGSVDDSRDRLALEIRFGGRTWQVTVQRIGDLPGGAWRQFWPVPLISLLLAALTWSLVGTHERSIALGIAMSERYRASEERFRKLNELLPCLVLLARREDGGIVYRNAVARDKLPDDAADGTLAGVFGPDAMGELSGEGDSLRSTDIEMRGTGGRSFWASVWVAPIEIDGAPMWLVVANDISEQRQLTERLSYQASHDSLTRLLNRREFEARIQALLGESARRAGALLFIDLDQFKLINDTSGHRAGDELLVQLASMMREQLRPDDLLGRLGGDEFGVLLSGVSTMDSAMLAAERLRRSIEGFVFTWDQRTYMASASIGAVMLSSASTLKELFAHADTACYLAKEGGRNRVHFHSDDDAAVTRRLTEMEWANKLRDAVRDGRLLLDYQELRPLQPGIGAGMHIELLLRLREEDGRAVPPGAFLPAAERYGLMPLLDRWVVQAALANIDRLHPQGAALATCAINLSGASLEEEHFADFVAGLLEAHSVDPTRVMFELTETVAMRDFAASSRLVSRLRGLGCKVALDDFGAGMSSFGYLKNLELDMVKIDGSFVQGLEHDRMSQSIVRVVTEIGHQQGMDVVAEWVSSPAMMAVLRAMGVDYAQGFALHTPERVVFMRSDA